MIPVPMLLRANTSAISAIGEEALVVVIVTVKVAAEAAVVVPTASVLPTLKATRVTSARLAGGVVVQTAVSGSVESGDVV